MRTRDYNPQADNKAVRRIWKECGWIDDVETDGVHVDTFFECANAALVGLIDDEPECAVHGTRGEMNYQDETIALGAVTAVTTSRVGRRQGFAGELTAKLLAREAEAGMEVSALGMFDQGFYNKVGFGTGNYEQFIRFDPSSLRVDQSFRPPKRLTAKDFEAIHGAMCARSRVHGGVRLEPPLLLKAELNWVEEGFGLGYYDGEGGSLSHFIFGSAKGEHGPYEINWRAWQSPDQLLELLALIRALGDQVMSVGMLEIGDIQLQDLLDAPFRHRQVTRGGKYVNESRSLAYWQARIVNLEACLAKTRLPAPDVKFNLTLTDPATRYLAGESWQGIGGDYVVTLGESSSASKGRDASLPTLEAGVGAFTRLWLGVRPASSLAITDEFRADPALLAALDRTVRLPRLHLGWDF